MTLSRFGAAAVITTTICGCDPGPTQPTGGRDDPIPPRRILQSPSFQDHIQEIFVRTGCTDSGCHGIGQAGLTLTTDVDANYDELVNVPAESEDFLRVEPFNPTDSYVIIKLEGRQKIGSQMPVGSPFDSIDLANMRNWITIGAPRN